MSKEIKHRFNNPQITQITQIIFQRKKQFIFCLRQYFFISV